MCFVLCRDGSVGDEAEPASPRGGAQPSPQGLGVPGRMLSSHDLANQISMPHFIRTSPSSMPRE